MTTTSKISLKHGYTLHFNEDGTFFLKVETEDDILEFDGTRNGNIIDASDFCEEDEPYKVTLEESIESARSWFKDWNIDEETIEAILKDLTPWFEKHAISVEEDIARSIANLENMVLHRREAIKQQMHSIDVEVETISKANGRIEAHTEKVLDLNKEIESYEKTIARLKAVLNKGKFASVDPEYTGGGIYVFIGELTDGNYFMADTSFYDVRILTEDPNEPTYIREDGTIWERNIDSVEWQEEHLVKDLAPAEAVEFFKEMLKWVDENKPNGNYNSGDMEDIKEELNTLKGDWR